jgi:hypothetical protein
LQHNYPSDPIWQTPTAFELVGRSSNPQILQFGLKMADLYARSEKLHPIKAWYAGLTYQKCGKSQKAEACFESLAKGDQYSEQGCKFDAMMELVKRYGNGKEQRSRQILQNLIRFKEYVSANDQQYKEAKEMLKQLD